MWNKRKERRYSQKKKKKNKNEQQCELVNKQKIVLKQDQFSEKNRKFF